MALAIDSSTPALASANSGNVATTASFTPPAGALLVAVGFHDTVGGNTTNTSAVTDSVGLAGGWSIKATRNRADGGGGQNGHVQISTAVVASSAAMTVTTTGTNCGGAAGVYVFVFTGADTTTPMDATPTEGSNTAGVISLAITTATDLAWAFLVATDWNVAANMTAGASQTAVGATGIGAGPDMRVYVGRQNATTSPAGAVTMSTASPSSGNTNNYIVFAVRPSAGGTTHNATVAAQTTAALTSTGVTTAIATAGPSTTAALTSTGVVTAVATSAPATTASLAGTGAVTRPATTATATTAALTADAAVTAAATSGPAATAALTVTGQRTAVATAALTTTATLGAAGTTGNDSAAAAGTTTALTATATVTAVATSPAATTAALTASATVTSGATRTLLDGPRLPGVRPLDSTRGTPSLRRRR